MPGQRKLLVALTTREAERFRDAFDLGDEEWTIGGIGTSFCGGFDRIVCVLPNHLDDVRLKNAVQHLTTNLKIGGELIFL